MRKHYAYVWLLSRSPKFKCFGFLVMCGFVTGYVTVNIKSYLINLIFIRRNARMLRIQLMILRSKIIRYHLQGMICHQQCCCMYSWLIALCALFHSRNLYSCFDNGISKLTVNNFLFIFHCVSNSILTRSPCFAHNIRFFDLPHSTQILCHSNDLYV